MKSFEIPSANFKLTRRCLFRFANHAKGNGECFKNDILSLEKIMFHFIQTFSQKIIVVIVSAAVAVSGLFNHKTTNKELESPKPEIQISNEQKETAIPKENLPSVKTNSVVVPKVVIPTIKPIIHKTFTLPSGAIVDENGNIIQSAPAQPYIIPSVDDASIGRQYYDSKKTCVGLSGNQYSSCVSYAFSPQIQAQNQMQATLKSQQEQWVSQQRKTEQINSLISEYNTQVNTLEQQILDITTQYYKDIAGIQSLAIPQEFIDGRVQKLTDTVNTRIQQIKLQEQQLYLNYSNKINAVQ